MTTITVTETPVTVTVDGAAVDVDAVTQAVTVQTENSTTTTVTSTINNNASVLDANVSSGTTFVTDSALDAKYLGAYVALVTGDDKTEVRRITGISGTTVTVDTAIAKSHSAGDPVFILMGDHAPAWLWGAHPGGTAAGNATRLQAAINETAGKLFLLLGYGTYSYDTTLTVPDAGAMIKGMGASDDGTPTKLSYTGTGNGIEHAGGWGGGTFKLNLQDFWLVGTGSAQHGIYLSNNSTYMGIIERVRISDFTQTGYFGLYVNDMYGVEFRGVRIVACRSGIYIGDVHIQSRIVNCYISNFDVYGIHSNPTNGLVHIQGGIVDAPTKGRPSGQIGIYIQAGRFEINQVHIEDVNKPYQIDSGTGPGYFAPTNVGTITNRGTIAADVHAIIPDTARLREDWTTQLQANLGTVWGNLWHGYLTPPTANNDTSLSNVSPIVWITASAAQNFTGFDSDPQDGYWGMVVLHFGDDNTTVIHNSASSANNRMWLRRGVDWNPRTNDALFVRKAYLNSNQWRWYEVGRYVANPVIEKTANYTITEGDWGRTFSNRGATGTVTLTLPAVTSTEADRGLSYSFMCVANQLLRIDPPGTDRFHGQGSGKYLELSYGDTATIEMTRGNNNGWAISATYGTLAWEP